SSIRSGSTCVSPLAVQEFGFGGFVAASGDRRSTIGGGREASITLEYLIEARKIAKPDILGHLRDRDVTVGQKGLGSLETHLQKVIAKGNSERLSESMRETILVHPNLTSQRRQRELIPVTLLDQSNSLLNGKRLRSGQIF